MLNFLGTAFIADYPQTLIWVIMQYYYLTTLLELEAVNKDTVRLTRSMASDRNILLCREILDEPEPAMTINYSMLPVLLDKAVEVSQSSTVAVLEKLYSLLAQKIYQHRSSYDRSTLLQVRWYTSGQITSLL